MAVPRVDVLLVGESERWPEAGESLGVVLRTYPGPTPVRVVGSQPGSSRYLDLGLGLSPASILALHALVTVYPELRVRVWEHGMGCRREAHGPSSYN